MLKAQSNAVITTLVVNDVVNFRSGTADSASASKVIVKRY